MPSKHALMPVVDLLVLHNYAVISFQSMNQLVCFVSFSVRELLVLPLDKLDSLVAVIRSLNLSRHLFLKSL